MTGAPPARRHPSAAAAMAVVLGLAWRTDRLRTALSFGLSAAEAVGAAGLAYGLKMVTDAVVGGDEGGVVTGVVVLVALSGAAAAGNWIGFMVRTRLREEAEVAVDRRLLQLTMGVPGLEHFERPDYADEVLLLRSQRGALSRLPEVAAVNLGFVVQAVTVLGLLAGVHPVLLLLPAFGVPSLLLTVRGEALVQAGHEATTENWRLRAELFDLATRAAPAKEVRLFALGDELVRRHQAVCRDIDRRMLGAELRAGAWTALGAVAFSAGFVGAVALVAWLAVNGQASAGDVVLAVALATHVNRELAGAVASVGWLARAARIARRFVWLSEHARAAADAVRPVDPVPVPDRLTAGIELVDVGFRYPGGAEAVLEGVSLRLPAGSTVAIVGDNGAGKTTLVKLLSRLHEPTAGRIVVDGIDLARIDVAEWRARLAAAFQDFVRYEVQAGHAVGVGDLPMVDDEAAIRRALDRASAGEVITALPAGLATQLGLSFDGGTDLSGGQWQKLALGRAMMREGPVLLLLDEPTAALDAPTEHALFERYAGAARHLAARTGAITVLVSHRFSTVRMADLIVVLDGGRVVEVGSHDDLVAGGGLYGELYELQARGYR